MDLPNRAGYEARIARVVGRVLRQQFGRFEREVRANPTPRIIDGFLDGFSAALRDVLEPELRVIAAAQVVALADQSAGIEIKQGGGVAIAFDIVNERAAQWATGYTFELVKGITDTTRNALQAQFNTFFESDEVTLDDMITALEPFFGPVRAQMIAVTETTRAASAGEAVFEVELNKLGLRTTQIWETSDDDEVCVICEPRDGKERGTNWTEPPPAHVLCRCWVNTIVVGTPSISI